MSSPIISFKKVGFRYSREWVLEDITLDIIKGSFVGIIGPNGSGKTTLMKLMLGLLPLREGSIELFGKPLESFNAWSRIGYVPQRPGLAGEQFPFTVEEVVAMGRLSRNSVWKFESEEDVEAIHGAMKRVGVWKLRKQLLRELSGGQQQRVYIARALATRPDLLVLDEPTVGVDMESQISFYKLLRKLNKEEGMTLVLVSHDVDVVAHEVNDLVCLNKKLVCHGTPREVMKEEFMEKVYGSELRFVVHGH